MPQTLLRLSQRQHPQFDAASAQFGQFTGDERLREFREDIDHVGNAGRRHVAFPFRVGFPMAARSEQANSTARLALRSQVK